MSETYGGWKRLLTDEALPAGVVDMDALDANIARIAEIAGTKKVRLATKSVRCPALIRYILYQGGPGFQGLMCYSLQEAAFLAGEGFDDFLVAYPPGRFHDAETAWALHHGQGKRVLVMVDEPAHLDLLTAAKPDGVDGKLPVCVDVDMSFRVGSLHLGVRRSPLHNLHGFQELVRRIQGSHHLQLAGVMGYEAHVAGVGDWNPFAPLTSLIVRCLKKLFVPDVARHRAEVARWIESEGISLEVFNGGGTGSLGTTSREPWITEVTAGSGFLQSHLFDYFEGNTNHPALVLALAVTRVPEAGIVTCQSGGFVASGATSRDKSPVVHLPKGLREFDAEGFGEVQTPFRVPPGVELKVGDPVLIRPAKAGEIAERFHEYLLKRGEAIEERVPTYRGMGRCFY